MRFFTVLFVCLSLAAAVLSQQAPAVPAAGKYAFVTIFYGDIDGVISSNLLATRVGDHSAVATRCYAAECGPWAACVTGCARIGLHRY